MSTITIESDPIEMYYFAYGSNLHPVRLLERVSSVELIGIAEYSQHRLTFHKRSGDGSSKCNILNSGSKSDLIYGAIYKLNPEHKLTLDRFEGNGYSDSEVKLKLDKKEYNCFTYRAQPSHIVDQLKPYHWYKKLVVLGAKYLEFPALYVSSIEAVESIEDQNQQRSKEMMALIENMMDYR